MAEITERYLKNYVSNYNRTMRAKMARGEVENFAPLRLKYLREDIRQAGDVQKILEWYRAETARGSAKIVEVGGEKITAKRARQAEILAETSTYTVSSLVKSSRLFQKAQKEEIFGKLDMAKKIYEERREELAKTWTSRKGTTRGEHYQELMRVLADFEAQDEPDYIGLTGDDTFFIEFVYANYSMSERTNAMIQTIRRHM